MKRIIADVGRCSGCRLCEMVCSFSKEDAFAPSTSMITVIKEDKFGLDLPIVCWHCNPCNVIENCPQEALERNKEGRIFVKEEKCVGCKECLEACVIGAIKLHPEKNIPQICDQCGGRPLCVQKCPTKALRYIETEEQEPRLPYQVFKETLRRWGISA
ncbi:MAG: 4Fe-4S dicluster domain-containing protein [Candidatus Bathyarchaeota archaeon]|nr:4Fe-4S dicluster domain-containing protein [Candidatus Bathyarchaeota archaeon]